MLHLPPQLGSVSQCPLQVRRIHTEVKVRHTDECAHTHTEADVQPHTEKVHALMNKGHGHSDVNWTPVNYSSLQKVLAFWSLWCSSFVDKVANICFYALHFCVFVLDYIIRRGQLQKMIYLLFFLPTFFYVRSSEYQSSWCVVILIGCLKIFLFL